MGHLDDVSIPDMQMSLWAKNGGCFLFNKWCAKTEGQYVGLIFGVIAVCLLYEMSAFCLNYFEAEYVRHIKMKCDKANKISDKGIMISLNMVKQIVGYALMLLMMTFNAGIITSLILSRCVFNFCFGILGDYMKFRL